MNAMLPLCIQVVVDEELRITLDTALCSGGSKYAKFTVLLIIASGVWSPTAPLLCIELADLPSDGPFVTQCCLSTSLQEFPPCLSGRALLWRVDSSGRIFRAC